MKQFDAPAAFAELRSAVRSTVTTPAPAAVRARAEHRLRRRRVVVVGLAAAAVVAIAAGVTAVVRPTAGPPMPPAVTSPAVTSPAVTSPVPTTAPLPSWSPPAPRPSLSVPVRPTNTVSDPIAQTAWANVTLTIPPREGCPSGRQRFSDYKTAGYPKLVIFDAPIVYGDLTNDGNPEAVLEVGCIPDIQEDHVQTALLVVTRDGGSLRTLGGWVGPVAWQVHRDRWVQDGRLFTEQQESSPGYDYAPGAAAAYTWNGASFDPVPSGLRSFLPTSGDGPPIDLGPDQGYIPRALNCPGGVLRIPSGGTAVERDGFVYDLTQDLSQDLPALADLEGDGRRYVIAQISCYEATSTPEQIAAGVGVRGQGVLVLDRTAAGFRAVDVITRRGESIGSWRFDAPGTITVSSGPFDGPHNDVTWTWNGQYFQL